MNNLFHLNSKGLEKLYNSFFIKSQFEKKGKFEMESGVNMFNSLMKNPKENFTPTLKSAFIYSKQLNVNDPGKPGQYLYLEQVEFQEYLGRIALDYWDHQPETAEVPESVEDKVFKVMQLLWDFQDKLVAAEQKKAGKGKVIKPFPQLLPLPIDSDDE